jgi:hypothetical protein
MIYMNFTNKNKNYFYFIIKKVVYQYIHYDSLDRFHKTKLPKKTV